MSDQYYNQFYQSLQAFDGEVNHGDPIRDTFQALLDNIQHHNAALYQVYDAVTRIYELREKLPRGLILDLWELACRAAKIDNLNLNLKLIADVFRHGYLNIQALLWADCHQSPNADLSNWFPHMLNVLHRFADAKQLDQQNALKELIREFFSVVNLQKSVYGRGFIDINHITKILNSFQQYEELGIPKKDENHLFPNITNYDIYKGTDDQKIAFLMCLSYLLTFSDHWQNSLSFEKSCTDAANDLTENNNNSPELVTDIRLQNLFLHWASLDQGGFVSKLLELKYGVRFLVVDQSYPQGVLQTHHGCDVWVVLAGNPKTGKTSFLLAANHENLVEFVNPDPDHDKRLELWKNGGPAKDKKKEGDDYSTSDSQTIVQTAKWKYFRVKLFDPRGEDINNLQNQLLHHEFYPRVFKTRSPSALILILNIDPDNKDRGAGIEDEIRKLLSIVGVAKQHFGAARDPSRNIPVYVLFNKCDQVGPDPKTALTLEPAKDKQIFPGNLPFFSSRSLGRDTNTVAEFKNALRFCDAAQKYPFFRSHTEHFINMYCELFKEVLPYFSNVNIVFCSSRYTEQHEHFPAVEALWSDICSLLKSGTCEARKTYFDQCQEKLQATITEELKVEINNMDWSEKLSFKQPTAQDLKRNTDWKDQFERYKKGIYELEEMISDSMNRLFTFLGIPYNSTYGALEKYPVSLGGDATVQQERSTILIGLRGEKGIDRFNNTRQVVEMLRREAAQLETGDQNSWGTIKKVSEKLREEMVANNSELDLHVDPFQGVFTTRCIIRDRSLTDEERRLFASTDDKKLKELFLDLKDKEKDRRLFCRTLRNYGMHGKDAVRKLPFDGWTVAELWDGDAYKEKAFHAENTSISVLNQEESATQILLECADLHDRCLWVKKKIENWRQRYQTLAWLCSSELTQVLKRQLFPDLEEQNNGQQPLKVGDAINDFLSLENKLIGAIEEYKMLRDDYKQPPSLRTVTGSLVKLVSQTRGVRQERCQEITKKFQDAKQDVRISLENLDSDKIKGSIEKLHNQVQKLKEGLTELENEDQNNFYGIKEKNIDDLWIREEELLKLPQTESVKACLKKISNYADDQKRVLVQLVATYMHKTHWFSEENHENLFKIVAALGNPGNGRHGAILQNPLSPSMDRLFSLLKSASDAVKKEQ